jgi:hypothetical protein
MAEVFSISRTEMHSGVMGSIYGVDSGKKIRDILKD